MAPIFVILNGACLLVFAVAGNVLAKCSLAPTIFLNVLEFGHFFPILVVTSWLQDAKIPSFPFSVHLFQSFHISCDTKGLHLIFIIVNSYVFFCILQSCTAINLPCAVKICIAKTG